METTKERLSKLEDGSVEIIQAEEQRKKSRKVNEQSLWYFLDSMKWPNISMID